MGAGDDLMSMWSDFTASGQIPGMSDDPHVTGMVSGQVTLEPGETKEVTIVLGWYFPDRDFLGIPVGMLLYCSCIHVYMYHSCQLSRYKPTLTIWRLFFLSRPTSYLIKGSSQPQSSQ